MMRNTVLAIALASVSIMGCSKKDGGSGGSAKAAEATPTKLTKLGLQIDIPGEVNVSDGIGGDGHMLMGEGIGAMSVETYAEPQTLDQAKSDADMFSPKNLKAETLPDGWALTFENTGSMGKNYFVEVRRDIGGKSYKCSTTSPDERAQNVLAACKTLRK